jgi:hypothetical protein
MHPEAKANQLYENFRPYCGEETKHCVLMMIDEILHVIYKDVDLYNYWKEVRSYVKDK